MKGASKKRYAAGYHPICLQCQEKRYEEIKRYADSRLLALYISCITFDSPFYLKIAKELIESGEYIVDEWIQYLNKVAEAKKNRKRDGDFCSFDDGDTDIKSVFEEENDEEEEASKWGVFFDIDGNQREYTQNEIKELENIYHEQAAEYKGAITPRVDMSLREISICRLEWKKRVGMGDTQGAKRYMDMIKDAMAREGMRAIDSKPLEAVRIDSIIDSLEKKGYVEDGHIVGKEKLIDILAKDHPQYQNSLDVVDAMMMGIINTMRKNNSESEITELPVEAQISDTFGELMPAISAKEEKNLEDTGVMIPKRARGV